MSGFEKQTYTQVPNSLFAVMGEMDECELKVVLYICRFTFGYHRDEVKVSTRKIAAAIGMNTASVAKGADAAEKRGLIERFNDGQNTTLWRAIVSGSDSENESPDAEVIQKVNRADSNNESQVGLNKDKEKNINAETPNRKPAKKGDILDGVIAYAELAKERGEDKTEATLQDLERGLRRNIPRSGTWQDLAKWINKQGNLQAWLDNYMADQFNARTAWRLTPEQIRNCWPSFAESKTVTTPADGGGLYV